MAYNDTPQEFLDNLTKENCPERWIRLAKEYKKNPAIVQSDDLRRLYDHIIKYILEDQKTTSETTSKTTNSEKTKKADKVEEPKTEKVDNNVEDEEDVKTVSKMNDYEQRWEDEKEQSEDEE